MGTDQNNPLSKLAAADLSSSRYCAVVLNSSEELALPSAGAAILGILYNKPEAAEHGTVWGPGSGQRKAKLGGTVASGDKCKVDSSGRFLLASAGDILAGSAVAVCVEGGNINEVGSVVLFGGAGAASQGVASESPSGVAGNYDLDEYALDSRLTLGTANRTGALPDGLYVGQRHRIRVVAASGGFTYALTPTTMAAGHPTSFTFTALGQEIELTWTATGYEVTGVKTAGAGTTAAAGTINPLIRRQGLTIGSAGAEDRILPSGWVAGHQITIAADTVGSGTTTISGLFYDEDGSADGIDATYSAALDEAVYTWDGARWIVSSIISVTVAP
jgi:hypothetical protein